MNKTLFKRSLAAMTGAVMVMGQAAATVTAAGGTSLVLTKDKILSVPVDTEALPALPASLAAPEYVFAEPVQAGESDWNDYASAFMVLAAGKGCMNVKLDDAKALVASAIAKTKKFSEDAVADLLTGISDANATATGSKLVMNATLSDVGPKFAKRMVNLMNNSGADIDSYLDFTGFQIAGSVKVTVDFGAYDKNVNVDVEFTDEAGKKYTIAADRDDMYDYAGAKYDELVALIESQIPVEVPEKELYLNTIKKSVTYLKAADKAVAGVSASATSEDNSAFSDAYDQYVGGVAAAINGLGEDNLISTSKKMRDAALKRIPATLEGCISSNISTKAYDAIVDMASDLGADLQVSKDDILGVYQQAYDVEVALNGYEGNTAFSIPDDQNADVLAACIEKYSDDLAAQNLKLTGVESHKEVELSFTGEEVAYYNVYRYIDKLTLEEIPETTTTSTETTTTSSSTSTETTTTSTETTTSSTSTETTTSSTSTETTTSSTSTETTTSSTSTDTTTSSTSTDTTTTSTDTTTTSTETTTSSTSFQVAPYEIVTETVTDSIGYYWTEEETKFSCLDNFSAVLNIAGEKAATLDGSCFQLANENAKSFGVEGYQVVDIKATLNETGLQKVNDALKAAGVKNEDGSDVVADANVFTAIFKATLVQRGNSQLDETGIDADDSGCVLHWYLTTSILNYKYTDEIAKTQLPGSSTDYAGVFYGCDVTADGLLTADDSGNILQYYLSNTVMHTPTTFNDIDAANGVTNVHEEVMHTNPFYKYAE